MAMTTPRYPHLVLDLTGVRREPAWLLARFIRVLADADPPIPEDERREILLTATALDYDHLYTVLTETVTVHEGGTL